MSESEIKELWQRIEEMPSSLEKKIFQTAKQTCSRIGEVISLKSFVDFSAHPTGQFLTVRIENYVPNLRNKQELTAWMDTILHTYQKMPDLTEVMKVKEPFAVFRVTTEKRMIEKKENGDYRHGWVRECARPLNPKYDPWTQSLADYIMKQQKNGEPIFPVDRQHMWKVAHEIFSGLTYTIQPYLRAKRDSVTGAFLRSSTQKNRFGMPKLLTELVMEHEKKANNHVIRHFTRQELEDWYGFTTKEADYFGGWSQTDGANIAGQRYVKLPWQNYAPRLLIPNQLLVTA